MKATIRMIGAGMALALLCGTAQASMVILAQENFEGGAVSLHNKPADTFIISTVGTPTGNWSSSDNIRRDGTAADMTPGTETWHAAYLDLGTHINDAKGTALGIFELTLGINQVAGDGWIGFGFENVMRAPDGSGVLRVTSQDELASFLIDRAGDGNRRTAIDNDASLHGPPTSTVFTIALDFTPGGGYDGSSNFGTIAFYEDGITAPMRQETFLVDHDFRSLWIKYQNTGQGSFDQITLSQIPEPSAGLLALIGLSFFALARRRRW